MVENTLLVLLIGVVALGVVRPMLNKILVPTTYKFRDGAFMLRLKQWLKLLQSELLKLRR